MSEPAGHRPVDPEPGQPHFLADTEGGNGLYEYGSTGSFPTTPTTPTTTGSTSSTRRKPCRSRPAPRPAVSATGELGQADGEMDRPDHRRRDRKLQSDPVHRHDRADLGHVARGTTEKIRHPG